MSCRRLHRAGWKAETRINVCKLSGHSLVVSQAAVKHERAEHPEAEGTRGKKGTMSFTGSAEQS
jgi:hypothetical protein